MMEWLARALITAGLIALTAQLFWALRRRRQPRVRAHVERWSERGWYLVRLTMSNHSHQTVSTIALEVVAPARASLLERGFIDRFAVPGRDGVRRPDAAAATRTVPMPMEAGPVGSKAVKEVVSHLAHLGVHLEEAAADTDEGEVLLYLPNGWRTRRVRLALHYLFGNRPNARCRMKLLLEIPHTLRNKW